MRSSRSDWRWAVPALAVATVVLRLPYLSGPEGSDEGGYLAIARQWHLGFGGGPSLYSHYWVDRPPLLITLFQIGSALGGLTQLRVVGSIAAAIAVLGVATATRQLAGPRAAVLAAAVSTVLFVTPSMGIVQVNGELIAAPFVAWGIALGAIAVARAGDERPGWAAYGAGALAVAALLIKQNMAEPAVFCAVAAFFAWRAGLSAPAVRRLIRAGVTGGLVMLVLIAAWTMAHGTSLGGVFDAMYPFRIRAGHVLTTFPDPRQTRRSVALLLTWLASGTALLAGLLVSAGFLGRLRGPAERGLLATLAYTGVSIVAGGGFWDHYLVETIAPISIAAGLLVAHVPELRPRPVFGRLVTFTVVAVLVIGLAQWLYGLPSSVTVRGAGIGTALAAVARPGDTIVTAFGDAEMVERSGLVSPYPYLWTLPAQTDDPDLTKLLAVLAGPDRPTWVVSWTRRAFAQPVIDRLETMLAQHYRVVGTLCGQRVFLRRELVRPVPDPGSGCRSKYHPPLWGATSTTENVGAQRLPGIPVALRHSEGVGVR